MDLSANTVLEQLGAYITFTATAYPRSLPALEGYAWDFGYGRVFRTDRNVFSYRYPMYGW